MQSTLTDHQLDALRELVNIASGTAATSLSELLGRPVELSLPRARALELADAIDASGPPEECVSAVVLSVNGDAQAIVLLLIGADTVVRLSELIGVTPQTEIGDSALCEIGNILGAAYLRGLSAMTGLELTPSTPHLRVDMRAAVLSSLLARAGALDTVLLLDSELDIAGESTAMSFLMLPATQAIGDLLGALGLAL